MQVKGVKGGRSYKPYAFTEQGIYMLMTVLKGEQATTQSKALIRLFKQMKDYIAAENAPDISAGMVALATKYGSGSWYSIQSPLKVQGKYKYFSAILSNFSIYPFV